MHRQALALAIVLAVRGVAAAPPQTPEVFVRSARWLDPESGELRGPSVFQIVGRTITRIIPAAEFDRAKRPGASVTDLGAATILPGLIDAHVHLAIGGAPADNAAAVLRAGFTTVVDLGATTDAVLRLRDGIAAGQVPGPRILAAGLWAGMKDGTCEFGGIGIAGGPDGFRVRVRENVRAGADLIKVCVSGWLADAYQKPGAYEISDAAIAAVVEEARQAKRAVVAHAISSGSVKAAVRAGVNGLAHAALIDQQTADAMQQRNMFMIPTLASLAGERTGPAAVGLRQSVALAHRAGVRIVFGTDGGVLPHGQNAREFTALSAAGLSPLECIRTATVTAARALNLGGAGTLATGSPADLIAVDGNPLEDLTALSRILFVMRDGKTAQ